MWRGESEKGLSDFCTYKYLDFLHSPLDVFHLYIHLTINPVYF